MGKHSARRRRGPAALATGAAAVLATGVFATTLADGGHELPRVAALPPSTPPTTLEPVSSRTTDRGEDLNRASRSFTRTPPPGTATDAPAAAPDNAPAPGAASSSSASSSASATRSAARTGTPTATPTASPSASPSPSPSPTAPATPSVTPTPSGSLLDVLPGVIGGLVR